ncbi:MAG TPA: phosphotransferase, partial [Roseiflexaceae bacterium]|nr:phosphotransferase [Roseiflexaceae bacterium]
DAAGWRHHVLVIVDHEITPDRNHFLALNLDHTIDPHLPPQQFVDAVYAAGGFGIIAHPDERVANNFKDIYRWEDWSIDGPSDRAGRPVGIELWNLMSDWGEHLTPRNKELLFFLPRYGISGPTADTLAWWDRLNMQGRRTFGVGGVDAHAFKRHVPWGEVEIFPYRWMFMTLTNYLLPDRPLDTDAAIATHQVYAALAAGRHYFVNRFDGACPQAPFAAERSSNGTPHRWPIGATLSLHDGPITLIAAADRRAQIQIIHNGRVLVRGRGAIRHSVVEPGIYRLEGYRGSRPWLYSNPIFLEP